MRKALLVLLFCLCTPLWVIAGSEDEAALRKTAPFSEMKKLFPTLTLSDYNRAISAVAGGDDSTGLNPTGRVYSYKTNRKDSYTTPSYKPYQSYTAPSYSLPKYRGGNYTTPQYQSAPRSGSTYDWQSGNNYNWYKNNNGTTYLRGNNFGTGSSWNTTLENDGSMRGFDKNYNYWTYDGKSGTYMNLGTGEICIGQGALRTCTK